VSDETLFPDTAVPCPYVHNVRPNLKNCIEPPTTPNKKPAGVHHPASSKKLTNDLTFVNPSPPEILYNTHRLTCLFTQSLRLSPVFTASMAAAVISAIAAKKTARSMAHRFPAER
jgi:hypothetical protein